MHKRKKKNSIQRGGTAAAGSQKNEKTGRRFFAHRCWPRFKDGLTLLGFKLGQLPQTPKKREYSNVFRRLKFYYPPPFLFFFGVLVRPPPFRRVMMLKSSSGKRQWRPKKKLDSANKNYYPAGKG